jgi:hypothetical protein
MHIPKIKNILFITVCCLIGKSGHTMQTETTEKKPNPYSISQQVLNIITTTNLEKFSREDCEKIKELLKPFKTNSLNKLMTENSVLIINIFCDIIECLQNLLIDKNDENSLKIINDKVTAYNSHIGSNKKKELPKKIIVLFKRLYKNVIFPFNEKNGNIIRFPDFLGKKEEWVDAPLITFSLDEKQSKQFSDLTEKIRLLVFATKFTSLDGSLYKNIEKILEKITNPHWISTHLNISDDDFKSLLTLSMQGDKTNNLKLKYSNNKEVNLAPFISFIPSGIKKSIKSESTSKEKLTLVEENILNSLHKYYPIEKIDKMIKSLPNDVSEVVTTLNKIRETLNEINLSESIKRPIDIELAYLFFPFNLWSNSIIQFMDKSNEKSTQELTKQIDNINTKTMPRGIEEFYAKIYEKTVGKLIDNKNEFASKLPTLKCVKNLKINDSNIGVFLPSTEFIQKDQDPIETGVFISEDPLETGVFIPSKPENTIENKTTSSSKPPITITYSLLHELSYIPTIEKLTEKLGKFDPLNATMYNDSLSNVTTMIQNLFNRTNKPQEASAEIKKQITEWKKNTISKIILLPPYTEMDFLLDLFCDGITKKDMKPVNTVINKLNLNAVGQFSKSEPNLEDNKYPKWSIEPYKLIMNSIQKINFEVFPNSKPLTSPLFLILQKNHYNKEKNKTIEKIFSPKETN